MSDPQTITIVLVALAIMLLCVVMLFSVQEDYQRRNAANDRTWAERSLLLHYGVYLLEQTRQQPEHPLKESFIKEFNLISDEIERVTYQEHFETCFKGNNPWNLYHPQIGFLAAQIVTPESTALMLANHPVKGEKV